MADDRTPVKLGNVPYSRNAGFAFHEVHIHLGQWESRGSEHSIDNQFYPMEVNQNIAIGQHCLREKLFFPTLNYGTLYYFFK